MQTRRIEDPGSDFLHRLADLADAQTLPRFRRPIGIDTKYKEGDPFDPVTDADRSAEAAMRSLIRQRFPDHAILGEEYGAEGESDYCWVLDPIDGTKPYLCGIPVWGSLIGLTHGGVAVRGMMSQQFTGERFWADADAAWHRRGSAAERLHTRQVALNEAILHTTGPQGYHGALAAGFDRLKDQVRMTRYGGECYAMVMVAAGHIDIPLEPSLQAYDIVALFPSSKGPAEWSRAWMAAGPK